MEILIILRNMHGSKGFFEDDELLCESDRNVIAEALELKEDLGGRVSVLLFADEKTDSTQTLIQAYTYGVDRAFLAFTGEFDYAADDCFSRLIADTIRGNFKETELVLFGRLAYDGDAVSISSMTAQRLRLPYVPYCMKVMPRGEKLVCSQHMAVDEDLTVSLSLPCVVHSIRKAGLRRQPKVADIIRTYSEARIEILDLRGLTGDALQAGGGLVLERLIEPEEGSTKQLKMLNGSSDFESAHALIDVLRENGFEADKG